MVAVVDAKNLYLAEALSGVADVRLLPTPAITASALRDVDAVIVRSETRVGPELLEGTPVRFVGTATIGTDHVDTDYLHRRGTAFASAPGSNANSVAEYVAAALLVVAERLGISLEGRTLGVVGVGNVGSRVVRVGEALGMHVLQNDPPRARATGDSRFVPLDALHGADVITLHVPLTRGGPDPTFHLVDGPLLSRLRRGAVLINTSRGGVVDSARLGDALRTQHLGAAVLDVWEHEPGIDMELLAQTAIGTPHIAGYSLDGKINAARMMFEALAGSFALRAHWVPPSNLPSPRHTELIVPDGPGSAQALERWVVTSCYTIEEDDAALRALHQLRADERAGGFRMLRARYPVRREFGATRLLLPEAWSSLRTPLAALGFPVALRHEAGKPGEPTTNSARGDRP